MSFSYSELSSLLSNKRLRLDKSISLNNLADKFQRASREFPSLARISRNSLEELILKGNELAFDSKKEGISGKDIELKFLLEARKNSFKIDSNIREYSFNDEDKLAFGMDEREFFDLFDRQERGLGEYLRCICQEMGRSSLPNTVALNHKLSGSCTHRDLMDKVQRCCSKKVVSLSEISEKLLQNIGASTPSHAQISDLAKKIADENRLNGSVENIYVWKDQTARLSTKAIGDLYMKNSLNHEDQRNLDQGFYILKQSDIDFAQQHKNLFWERILPDSSERNTTLQARSKAGYTNDISSLRAGKKLFIADKKAVKKVESAHGDSLKKLVELAKICEISLPSDFTSDVLAKTIRDTHNKSTTSIGKIMEDTSWGEINKYKNLPAPLMQILKKNMEGVIKACLY